MALTFRFQINKIEASPSLAGFNDVVVRVRYDYIGTDENGKSAAFAGVTPIPAPTEGGTFKNLSDLNEIDVLSWLHLHADKEHMEERIAKKLQYDTNQYIVEVALPWSPGSLQPVQHPEVGVEDSSASNMAPTQE